MHNLLRYIIPAPEPGKLAKSILCSQKILIYMHKLLNILLLFPAPLKLFLCAVKVQLEEFSEPAQSIITLSAGPIFLSRRPGSKL